MDLYRRDSEGRRNWDSHSHMGMKLRVVDFTVVTDKKELCRRDIRTWGGKDPPHAVLPLVITKQMARQGGKTVIHHPSHQ